MKMYDRVDSIDDAVSSILEQYYDNKIRKKTALLLFEQLDINYIMNSEEISDEKKKNIKSILNEIQ